MSVHRVSDAPCSLPRLVQPPISGPEQCPELLSPPPPHYHRPGFPSRRQSSATQSPVCLLSLLLPLEPMSFSATCRPGFLSKLPSQPTEGKEGAAIPAIPASQSPCHSLNPPPQCRGHAAGATVTLQPLCCLSECRVLAEQNGRDACSQRLGQGEGSQTGPANLPSPFVSKA